MKKLEHLYEREPDTWEEWVVIITLLSLVVTLSSIVVMSVVLFFITYPLALFTLIIPILWSFYRVLTDAND